MHLHKVHLITVTNPVRKDNMHCNQVLQVDAQYGDFKSLALVKSLSVAGVVVVGRDQISHLAPYLGQEKAEICNNVVIKSQINFFCNLM